MAATPMASSDPGGQAPRVYVVVLNWNGWGDTIACLESLLRSDYANYRIVVCDNASTDDSVVALRRWAAGELDALPPRPPRVNDCVRPPVTKPIAWCELDRETAETGEDDGDPALTLIHTGANLGYAGGNNVGLRYVRRRGDADYVWLLNNDTVVDAAALRHLVTRLQTAPEAGLCGSTLLDQAEPTRVQAHGGARFNPWLGTHRALGDGQRWQGEMDADAVERRMSYVIGASMFASRRWIERVGLLCEDYFLYFEEIDWAVRGRPEFTLAYAPQSLVYHKEGASTGRPERSVRADCLALRNRLLFTRNRLPWALPTVWLGLIWALINRIRRGQLDRVRPILTILLGRSRTT